MANTNIIELNGKSFDASTGQVIGQSSRPMSPRPSSPVMDIVGPRPARRQHHVGHHQPQHTTTLARHAVKRPEPSLKRHVKVQARTDVLARTPALEVVPKLSFGNLDSQKLHRASHVPHSQQVSRFGASYAKPAANHHARSHASTAEDTISSVSAPVTTPAQDIFERALTEAKSHEQAPAKAKRRRVSKSGLGLSAAVVAVLVAGSFVAYLSKASLTMSFASKKAGFHASLPAWKPSGFAPSKFAYSPGNVAVNFNSPDSRSFNLSEKPSNWDSNTLLNNFVAAKSSSYQIFQAAGRILYLYGNNNAAWVNGGIMYNLSGNGSLSTDQILRIASSM